MKEQELENARLLSRNNPRLAIQMIEEMMQSADAQKDHHLLGLLEYEIGNAWFILADSSHSLEHLSKACTLLKEAGDWESFSHAESLIGITFMNQGNMASAMAIFSEEVTLSEKNHDPLSLYKAECILGQCFFYAGLYEKALDYFDKANILLDDNPDFRNKTESIPIAQAVTVMAQSELHMFSKAKQTLGKLKKTLAEGSRFASGPFAVIPECYLLCMEDSDRMQKSVDQTVRACLSSRETSGDCLMILSQFELLLVLKEMWQPLKQMILMMEEILKGKDYYKVLINTAWAKCRLMHAIGRSEEAYKAMQAYARAALSSQQAAVSSGLLYVKLRRELESISQENEVLKVESSTDELTHISNRRGMNHLLYEYFEKAQKDGKMLAVGIMDIDLFKGINDRFGHQEGDRCLQILGQVLLSVQNEHLHAARYGGDEFVLIGFDMQEDEIKETAKQIQDRLLSALKETECIPITVSQGYYGKIPGTLDTEWNYLTQADQALYQAKQKHCGDICIRMLSKA